MKQRKRFYKTRLVLCFVAMMATGIDVKAQEDSEQGSGRTAQEQGYEERKAAGKRAAKVQEEYIECYTNGGSNASCHKTSEEIKKEVMGDE